MNRIVIAPDIFKDIDNTIIFDDNIKIINNTNLILEINSNTNLTIEIDSNITANIYLLISTSDVKLNYILNNNSNINIYGYTDNLDNGNVVINLNGINSNINYIMKTLSNKTINYKYMIYHNDINSSSNIINNGVNIDNGNLIIDISSYVPNGITGCNVNQISRIINLTNNKCIIRPNLLINEEDVTANHSALIGTFSNDEIFYLESRGINYKDTVNLLVKGFLYSKLDQQMKDIIKNKIEYWR